MTALHITLYIYTYPRYLDRLSVTSLFLNNSSSILYISIKINNMVAIHFYQNQYYGYYDYYHHYYYHHYYYHHYYHRRPFDYTTASPFKVYGSGYEFCMYMYLLVSIRVRLSSTMIYKVHEISKHKSIHTHFLVATVTDIAYATL